MHFPRQTGTALVITLAMIVLITIMMLGFVGTARLDVASAKLHIDGVRAGLYAQTGEDIVLAKLKSAVTSHHFWISEPGRIVTYPAGTRLEVDLSSGKALNADPGDVAVDLNPPLAEDPNEHLLVPAQEFGANSPKMRVRWIYVRKDGSFETALPPAYDPRNPVEGRFAYWVDDECAKINFNTAWTKGILNTKPLSHPSRIELESLLDDPSDVAEVQQYRQTYFFNSPDEPRRVNSSVAGKASSRRFLTTHYNHAPELSMFGEPRVMLTTQLANLPKETREMILAMTPAQRSAEGHKYFLDVLANDNTDPGKYDNLSTVKVDRVVNYIAGKLARNDWPIAPGKNFLNKYSTTDQSGANDPHAFVQIALGIVDYVRSKESSLEFVSAIRGDQAKSTPPYASLSGGNGMMGLSRRPLLSELAVWADPVPLPVATGGKKLYLKFYIELYLPKGGGRIDLSNCTCVVGAGNPTASIGNPIASQPIKEGPPPSRPLPGEIYLDSSDHYLEEGKVRVLTGAGSLFYTTRPSVIALRVTITGPNGKYGEMAPMSYGSGGNMYIEYKLDPATPTGPTEAITDSRLTSMSVADPVANKSRNDWTQSPHSFGRVNDLPSSLPAGDPQWDADSSGNVFRDGAQIPAPKGDPRNPHGIVESVGELGFIHTGINGSRLSKSVPFRTLRLQPQARNSVHLPDWAILDLFCAPALPSADDLAVTQPDPQGSGGRINLNNKISSFVDEEDAPVLARIDPLIALLAGAKKAPLPPLTSAETETLAEHVNRRDLAVGSANPGQTFADSSIYYSPWQIVEVAGVAEGGEESEALVREIGGLASARSNVFSIYSIGQSVRQLRDGRVTLLGERRSHTIVECRTRVDGASNSMKTVYETVYSRDIQP